MIGQTISHYKIIEKLGEGGMGVVYKAEDASLNRIVALKFLPPQNTLTQQDNDRFLREAQTAAVLNHPNVCTIYSIEKDESNGEKRQFIVMEYMEGMTLREKLAEGNLSLDVASQYAIQIGEALHEAHSKNIVHRDIKADNVMVTAKNKIKVMDFGLAKLKGSLKLTRTSSTVGTLAYMAPEQIQGGEVDSRSDIFAFGVLFYEMLTGRMPFRGEHQAAMVYSIVNEPAESIAKYLPEASQELMNIFAKALEKDPDERYQTAIDMVVDIRRLKKQTSKITSVRSLLIDSTSHQPVSSPSEIYRTPTVTKIALWNSPFVLQIAIGVFLFAILGILLFSKSSNTSIRMNVTQLTDMPGEELQPDYSPDGNYVAFSKQEGEEENIYLQRIGGGNPINLTKDSHSKNSSPSFSSNGDQIAFCSDRDGGGIYLMGSTGESVRRLTKFGSNPAWSPDGKKIAFATEAVRIPQARYSTSQLWIVSVENGSTTLIDSGDVVQPQWSPDGNRIVYWGLPIGTGWRDLWSIDSEGKNKVRITNDPSIDWNPLWSPDGHYIYFLSDRSGSMNVWRIAIDQSTGKTKSDPEQMTVPASECSWLTLSHDGKKVIYSSLEKRTNIFKMGFDPMKRQFMKPAVQITTGSKNYNWLDISPDGKRIATTSSGIQEDIYVMNSDGTNIRRLTNDISKDRGVHWSIDGTSLYSYSDRSGKYELWKINADGSGQEQMTKGKEAINNPHFFSNGRNVIAINQESALLFDLTKPIDQRLVKSLPPILGTNNRLGVTDITSDDQLVIGSKIFSDGHADGIFTYSLSTNEFKKLLDYGSSPLWVDGGNMVMFFYKKNIMLLNRKNNSIAELDSTLNIRNENLHTFSSDRRTFYYIKVESESDIWQATIQ
jgi:serine/threonine protein kinase